MHTSINHWEEGAHKFKANLREVTKRVNGERDRDREDLA